MRTFIAIELPAEFRASIGARQQDLRTAVQAQHFEQGLRWETTDKLHLTLRFLGETNHRQLVAVQRGLQAVAAQHSPFTLTLGGLGCFPNVRWPSVIWLGIGGAEAALRALQHDVESVVLAAGFSAERRRFAPHLTLARVGRDVAAVRRRALGSLMTELAHLGSSAPSSDSASSSTPSDASLSSAANAGVQQPAPSFRVDSFAHVQSRLQPAGAVYTQLAAFALQTTD